MTRLTARRLVVAVHRWAGLAMSGFLVVAGLTGTAIAFYDELDAAVNPRLLRAEAPAPDTPRLDPLALVETLERHEPGIRVTEIPLEHRDGAALRYYAVARDGAGPADDEHYLHPYTGAVLGSRRWGDLEQGGRNLVPFLYRLHYSLALGAVGQTLMGVIALLWTLDCFWAAWLTFPPPSPRGPGARRSWWIRWLPSWSIRGGKTFSLVFTWHRASGLWIWAMLLVFAWSSVGINLRPAYEPVMGAALGFRPAPDPAPLAAPRPEPRLSWREALAAGRAHMGDLARAHGFTIAEERLVGYDAVSGTFRYRVRSSLDVSDRYASTTVYLDGDTGRLLSFEAPTGETAGNTVTTWLNALHFGAVAAGGRPYRVFVAVMGLAVVALSVTGVWIWWRRRRRRT